MPQHTVRSALLAVLFTPFLLLQAAPVSRTAPEIYHQHIVPLLTPLEEVLAGRDAFPDSKAHGTILLDEVIHYRDDTGVDYLVFHDVFYARSDSAREVMNNRIYSFDREHDSIFLISAATIRPGGERQNLDDRAAFIQTPQREAENGLYTSEQELNLIFPQIGAGAIIQAIVLIREDKPIFPGEFATHKLFASGWPIYRTRMVVDFPRDLMARMKIVETSPKLPKPVVEESERRVRRTWTQAPVVETDWEESAPALRFRAPAVWLTTLESWQQVGDWFSDLANGRDELGPDLEQVLERQTAGLDNRRAIVDRLCALVANEVRYTGLEFGLAGYQPYPCAEVWKNRYGDCKDKANLLRALLARKGIPAHFLLLHTGRLGRVESRSPSWKQFNHVILAVEDGDGGYWYCDPTIRQLPAGKIGLADSARPALLLNGSKTAWHQTPDTLDNVRRYGAELSLAPTGELSGWFSIRTEGADAASYADYYNNQKPSDRRRALQDTVEDFYPGAEVIDVAYQPETGSLETFSIRAYFLRKAGADSAGGIGFGFPASWLPSADTATERVFPYAAQRRLQAFDATIRLPSGWNASQVPAPFKAESAAASFAASWQSEPSRLRMQLTWHPTAAEIPAKEYAVFQRSVRALRTWLEQTVRVAPGESTATATPSAPDNFPILPTGEGQLRLLSERFPSGERDGERRAALEQILHWFPDDPATSFTARIYLSLLDSGNDHQALAVRIGEILTRYDANISHESKGWARYLQNRALWWAKNDPAALQALRDMAADTKLSDYRRSWCAHYAALFLSESSPAEAMALLSDWDVLPQEARESMLKAEAGYLTKLVDPTVTTAWAQRLIEKQSADADALLSITLAEALARKDRLPASAFEHLARVLAPLLADDESRFAKTTALLKDIRQLGEAGRQRREFIAALSAWIEANPRTWINRERSAQFTDLAALEKHLDAMNDARDGKAVVDAGFQLARYHECDYDVFAKYLYWAAWWLEKQQIDPALLAELARLTHALPQDSAENIGAIWFKQASAERKAGNHAAARREYQAILAGSTTQPFQLVEASGELALMELELGDTDAAIAAFALTAKNHLTHKQGSEYLTVAIMLHLGRGEWDRAEHLLAEVAKTKKEYRDATAYGTMLEYLLAGRSPPGALRAYWERGATWRPAWDSLLAKHGVKPAEAHKPALVASIGDLQNEIASAATTRDAVGYLTKLDLLARTAQFIPVYLLNFCNQTARAQPLASELRKDLMEIGLQMVQGFPDFDPAVHWDTRLWEVAFLFDLGRLPDASRAARTLHPASGPSEAIRSAALQLWLAAASEPEDLRDAIDTATRMLAENSRAADRLDLITSLSDALNRKQENAAHIELLSRELSHPEVVANADRRKNFEERLDTLRLESQAGEALTKEILAWQRERNLQLLDVIPPLSLDAVPQASPGSSGLYERGLLSSGELVRCNWLLALDSGKPVNLRARAFSQVVIDMAYFVPQADNYAGHFVAAAKIKSLPDDVRFDMLSTGIAFLAKNGHAAAEKVLDGASNSTQREALRKAYEPSFSIIETLNEYSEAKAAASYRLATSRALGGYESRMVRALLSRMAAEEQTKSASSLIEESSTLQVFPGSGLTSAGLRLDWSRHLRRETSNLPFYRQIRDILVNHASPTDADTQVFRRLTWAFSVESLPHADRVRAMAAAFSSNLFSVADPLTVISRLSTATGFLAHDRDLGPELEIAIIQSPDLDDATRAQWLELTLGLSDPDDPRITARLEQAITTALARTEPALGSGSRRALRTRLALMALHSSPEERPDALFGKAAARDMDATYLQLFQLAFHVTRHQRADAGSLMQQIDADQLADIHIYPFAAETLSGANDEAELKLLKSAAVAKLRNRVGDLWLEPRPMQVLQTAFVAGLLEAQGLLTPEFFSHAVSQQADELDRRVILLARASHTRDWAAQKKTADAILGQIPDNYDILYYRGEANHHLGKHKDAKADLKLFLEKVLDSGKRASALRMLASMPQ